MIQTVKAPEDHMISLDLRTLLQKMGFEVQMQESVYQNL